ncbi:LysR family transcriptional regulator [uncultured Roseobacter sp.]|uniref:LysR family transcriptional regulator n=2 Tax=uncultured Roseobacter sp. TaxID=114847 RepID=UPI00262ECFDD|nr:LysR family transcriptional regulator [uncultured Roseobacter sp.]
MLDDPGLLLPELYGSADARWTTALATNQTVWMFDTMNLRDLLYVIAVAEHRNFTRASQVVAVSQPALSNQIKKLEAELGMAIFERGRNEVRLTDFGAELVVKAQEVSAMVDGIRDLAHKHRAVEDLPLRLGMTPTLAAYLSRYFNDLFAAAFPNVRMVIVEEYPIPLARMVEDKSIDMAFIARKSFDAIYEGSRQPMDFASLWLEPLYLGVRLGHPLARKNSIWAHEVPANILIRFDTSFGYDLEARLPEASAATSDVTGIDVRSARFETVCRHVAQSDACTMINAIAAEQFKRDGFGLEFVPFDDEGNMRELGVLTRPEYPRPEVIKVMRDHILKAPPIGTVASRTTKNVLRPAPLTVQDTV